MKKKLLLRLLFNTIMIMIVAAYVIFYLVMIVMYFESEKFEDMLIVGMIGWVASLLYLKFVIEPDMKELHEEIHKL